HSEGYFAARSPIITARRGLNTDRSWAGRWPTGRRPCLFSERQSPAASSTTRLTMEQSPPPDPEIVGWLTTLGVTSLCQWDILVFFYRHHTTLLGAEAL